MEKKIQLSILSVFLAAGLVGSLVASSDYNVFATGKHNDAIQILEQSSLTGQDSTCDSDDRTIASCNNLAFTANLNDGNNGLGQQ